MNDNIKEGYLYWEESTGKIHFSNDNKLYALGRFDGKVNQYPSQYTDEGTAKCSKIEESGVVINNQGFQKELVEIGQVRDLHILMLRESYDRD